MNSYILKKKGDLKMNQCLHILGAKIEGKMCRFKKIYSEEEFKHLLNKLGGVLPPGFVAWHIEEGKNVDNSTFVKKIANLPLIYSKLTGNYADPELYIDIELEAQKNRKENGYVQC